MAEDFQTKLAEAQAADAAKLEGGNTSGEEESPAENADEGTDEAGQEEVLNDTGEAEAEADASSDDDEVDATPRVSLKKHQKTEERARKAEQLAFEANTRLQAFMDAQKLSAPIAERVVEAPQNPYDKDLEPERHELWETKQKADTLEKRLEKFEQTQQQTEEQTRYIQSKHLLAQTTFKAINQAKNSGRLPHVIEAYNFVDERLALMKIDQEAYHLQQVITPVAEGRQNEIPDIYYNLAVSMGFKPAKKVGQPNLDAVERNRSKSQGLSKSGTAQTTGSLNIKQAARKDGRGTDPTAFAALLQGVRNIP